jgi:ABC-type bacteriocin/lantibiotic exporter with double-glycine peptidase domain
MHIQIEKLSYSVDGQVVLKNLTIDIPLGQKCVLAWPSGTGKTSLLRLLFGLAVPTSGKIMFDGQELNGQNVRSLRKSISYINQQADLHVGMVENVVSEIFSYPANIHITDARQRLLQLMPGLNLNTDLLLKQTSDLSGGERQRLLFLLCKILDRPVWLLDEITSGLDIENKRTIVSMVAESKQTVIISSHDAVWHENPVFHFLKLM